MKKLFIIAISILALVAFTTPATAGSSSYSAGAWAENAQTAVIGGGALIVPGVSIALEGEEASDAGLTYGSTGFFSTANANQNTHYEYAVGYGGGSPSDWSVVAMEGNMDQASGGAVDWWFPGSFYSAATADQEAGVLTFGGVNFGYSGLGNEVDVATTADAFGADWWGCYYYDYSVASASASSVQNTQFATFHANGPNFTYHAGSAYAGANVAVADYGDYYDYYGYHDVATASATAANTGGIVTNFSSNGGVMNMSGAIGAASAATVNLDSGWNGYAVGSAAAGTHFEYIQQQVTPNGYQFQTGETTTNVSVLGGGS